MKEMTKIEALEAGMLTEAGLITPYGSALMELEDRHDHENFLKRLGYPSGIDFMTMVPLYYASPEAFEDYITNDLELAGESEEMKMVSRSLFAGRKLVATDFSAKATNLTHDQENIIDQYINSPQGTAELIAAILSKL